MNDSITFETPLLRGRFIVFNQRPEIEFLKVKQTHSNLVIPEELCGVERIGDGIVGQGPTPKAILTADCVPLVLLGKTEHTVIHAGWKGLADEILMSDAIKKIGPTYAFIGPHIRPENYEVQKDFMENFRHYPEAFTERNGKTYFDLSHVALAQLKNTYPNIVVVDCGLCTFSDLKFHSYRRDKTTQRNWNVYFPN